MEIEQLGSLENLVSILDETNNYFRNQVQKQVNVALTLRNWLFGLYIVEYELNGIDRAVYGKGIYKEIANRLLIQGNKHFRERHLYLCKDFYLGYPEILLTPSAKSYFSEFDSNLILRSVSAKLEKEKTIVPSVSQQLKTDSNLLLNRLSFSHFLEFLKIDNLLQRSFYEVEAIKNNWSVRALQRAMNSMLFERTGLSTDKKSILEKHKSKENLKPEDLFRNPYLLEFLGLEEKSEYSETDLEQSIINHLQTFLLEMGRGFCFEGRQKRITFDNVHYRIDLVFYHRILKCNILLDLKLGEFTHADAGQMNVYLNYFRENEMNVGDNPPVGIILCASKNENLVRYATAGLPQQVFVSKYMINLPSEADLEKIIAAEQDKFKI